MLREAPRPLACVVLFSSLASTAAAQTQPAPAPDVTALREEVQRLRKEVESLKARLDECSSSRPAAAAPAAPAPPAAVAAPIAAPAAAPAPPAPAAPAAPPDLTEFRYQEALAAVKAIGPTCGISRSEFKAPLEKARVKVAEVSGSGPREEGLRKVMRLYEKAGYEMDLGAGVPGSVGMQRGLELCLRGQAAFESYLAAQAKK